MGSDERLEQRVKTLEYELKILKNEIQHALLEIQEQILTHYYPALRLEQPNQPEITPSFRASQEKQGAAAGVTAGGEGVSPEASPVRKVSLEDIRKACQEPAEAAQAQLAQNPKSPQADLMALTGWASSAVPKIGKERATKLLEAVSQRGYLGAEAKDLLVKLCTVASGDSPVQQVATSDLLAALLRLNESLGCGTNVEEALLLIDEAKLG